MASSTIYHPVGVNCNDKLMGQTRMHNGKFQQREHDRDNWHGAVFHNTIRDDLIRQAASLGSYVRKPKAGEVANDITSFHHENKLWGPLRANRPPRLFQLHRTKAGKDAIPQNLMMFDNKYVLDYANHRMLDFAELPAKISSAIGGWEIENFCRQNDRINYGDIMARQLASSIRKTTANKLQMRRKRFRLTAGCVSWKARDGTDYYTAWMKRFLGPICVWLNSSQPFRRDLTQAEVQACLAGNKGKNPNRKRNANRTKEEQAAADEAWEDVVEGEEEEEEEDEEAEAAIVKPKTKSAKNEAKELHDQINDRASPQDDSTTHLKHFIGVISNQITRMTYTTISVPYARPSNADISAPYVSIYAKLCGEETDEETESQMKVGSHEEMENQEDAEDQGEGLVHDDGEHSSDWTESEADD